MPTAEHSSKSSPLPLISTSELEAPLLFFDEQRFLADINDNPIQVFRDALSAANQHFDNRFEEWDNIESLVTERAQFMDKIIRCAWNQFEWDKNIALLAVGGYGRGELHPQSDIDLLILTRRNNHRRYQQSIEQFLTFLWDIQLKIGHSVRSVRQCVDEAKADITIATNVMETRLICGDNKLRQSMLKKTSPRKIWPSEKFFLAKLAEQDARHDKHGNTEYNLEPNIKEAPGGLRDIQTISWVAKRHYQVDSLEQLVDRGFITKDEYRDLKNGENILWRVRYGLHLIAGRPEERLLFDHQRKLAETFGYKETENRMAVEQFMHHYYQTVLSIRAINDALLQYLDEAIIKKDRTQDSYTLNERFRVRDNFIETVQENLFSDHPSALLEIFCLLGENPAIEGIRAATIRQIKQYRHLVDEAFRQNPENQALFLRLMRCKNLLSLQLQRMTRYGILGRYLPEFGAIIGQMQHDLFHIYPVDAHTLQVIKNMRRFDRPEVAKDFPVAAHIHKNLPRPELLYIAGLYHDIAKGRRGDHSTLGAVDVEEFGKRHGLADQEIKLMSWLVANHLLMSSTSQRQDIGDPEVIHKFATLIGDQLHLDYLFVMTVADINATNPTLWNSWKGSLMDQLYVETRRALQRGIEKPVDRNQWADETQRHATAKLQLRGIRDTEIQEIWGNLDQEFFIRASAEDITTHTAAIYEHGDNPEPLILIKDVGAEIPVATEIFIYTRGLSNVFAITAATLDQLYLTIQDARLQSNDRGDTFDTFYVLDENDKPCGNNAELLENIRKTLIHSLQFPTTSIFQVQRRTSRQMKHFTMRTTATISNDISNNMTVLEVISPDRPGLLAHLGRIFMRFGVVLMSAKIATLGERVEDVFHLADKDRQPLSDPKLCTQLSETICTELDGRNQEDLKESGSSQMSLIG